MAVPRPGRRGAWLGIIWLGVAQELVTTGQQMGASGSGSPKPKINMRRLDQVQKPLLTDNCRQSLSTNGKRNSLWVEGVVKGISSRSNGQSTHHYSARLDKEPG